MATTSRVDDHGETVSVLIVDGESEAGRFAADALAAAEPALTTTTETSAWAALERLEREPFDCIVTEYHLSEMDGLALLDRAREVAPDIRGVVHTSADDPAIAEQAWARSAAYARKGVSESYTVLARHLVGRAGPEQD